MTRRVFLLTWLWILICAAISAQQSPPGSSSANAELKFVVYLSRHGVRSPTGKTEQYNAYSIAAWPEWSVPSGYLTAHGYHLMELFGAYQRLELSKQGLFAASGCEDAAHVTIHADSDQRTRETANALTAGMFPGCSVPVHSLPEGMNDPLFHFVRIDGKRDSAMAAAAVAGRIGGNPDNFTAAYRSQLVAFDHLLATCGMSAEGNSKRRSILEVATKLAPGDGDHALELRGPLYTASTLTENLLLEYSEGMESVGWGCVDGAKLRSLIDLHTAAADFSRRTKPIAQIGASNLLDHIRRAMEQAVSGKPIAGAPDAVSDRALFLIGHDTNLTNIAGMLDLNWIVDGRRDDTPPGGILIFELWKNRSSGEHFVRSYYSAQTLEQMRSASKLTLDNPPERAPIYMPRCSENDLSCSWPSFLKMLREVVDSNYVSAP